MIPMWTIEVGKDGNVYKDFLRATTSTVMDSGCKDAPSMLRWPTSKNKNKK